MRSQEIIKILGNQQRLLSHRKFGENIFDFVQRILITSIGVTISDSHLFSGDCASHGGGGRGGVTFMGAMSPLHAHHRGEGLNPVKLVRQVPLVCFQALYRRIHMPP